jgi:hypothetical protein
MSLRCLNMDGHTKGLSRLPQLYCQYFTALYYAIENLFFYMFNAPTDAKLRPLRHLRARIALFLRN